MSQQIILDWLKQHPQQKYTAAQLVYFLGLSSASIHKNLHGLRKNNEVNVEWGGFLNGRYQATRYYSWKEI